MYTCKVLKTVILLLLTYNCKLQLKKNLCWKTSLEQGFNVHVVHYILTIAEHTNLHFL